MKPNPQHTGDAGPIPGGAALPPAPCSAFAIANEGRICLGTITSDLHCLLDDLRENVFGLYGPGATIVPVMVTPTVWEVTGAISPNH